MKRRGKKRGRFTPSYIHEPVRYIDFKLSEAPNEKGVRHYFHNIRWVPVPKYKTRKREGASYASVRLVDRKHAPDQVPPVLPTHVGFCPICKQRPGLHQECERKLARARLEARSHGHKQMGS